MDWSLLTPHACAGKKNVHKRMLKYFAKGEKSAGAQVSRLLLKVQAHAVQSKVEITPGFVDSLNGKLDEACRSQHKTRFQAFFDAVKVSVLPSSPALEPCLCCCFDTDVLVLRRRPRLSLVSMSSAAVRTRPNSRHCSDSSAPPRTWWPSTPTTW